MNAYSKISQVRLNECHRDLQIVFEKVLPYFDHSIICGTRGEQEQNVAFESGFSKVKYPNSKHNSYPSMAVDVMPYPIDWEDEKRMIFFAGFVMATAKRLKKEKKISHEIRWGGDWDRDLDLKDNKFQDYPHYELLKQKVYE